MLGLMTVPGRFSTTLMSAAWCATKEDERSKIFANIARKSGKSNPIRLNGAWDGGLFRIGRLFVGPD